MFGLRLLSTSLSRVLHLKKRKRCLLKWNHGCCPTIIIYNYCTHEYQRVLHTLKALLRTRFNCCCIRIYVTDMIFDEFVLVSFMKSCIDWLHNNKSVFNSMDG